MVGSSYSIRNIRLRHDQGGLLDLVLSSSDNLVSNIQVHGTETLPIQTDHNMISFTLNLSSSHCRTYLNMDRALVYDYILEGRLE